MTGKMESYMQTNNDLIIAIHKTIVASEQQIDRKIENLRDDIRDVKLSLTNTDRVVQEEANNWRQHTETIIKELGERHEREMVNLQKMIMELCIRTQSAPATGQVATALPKETHLVEQPVLKPAVIETVNNKKEVALNDIQWKVAEPVGFKPPIQTAPQTTALKPITPSAAPINWTAQLPNLPIAPSDTASATKNVQQSWQKMMTTGTTMTIQQPIIGSSIVASPIIASAPISTAAAPALISMAAAVPAAGTALPYFRTTAPPFQPTQQQQINASTTSISTVPPAAAATTVMPTPAMFSFKGSSMTTNTGTGSFQDTGASPVLSTGSLFGGGAKSGTNTFANLAAKAAESGGGFLGNIGAPIGKQQPQFGQSSFGPSYNTSTAKDFKLFQQPSPQPSLTGSGKGLDESSKADDSDKEDQGEEFVPDVHYEPVVPLPPEIEVATGEEEEETIFSARCKLYRYDKEAKENKERGLGDIKLLFNPRSKRYRCVMRREQVLKLCANFPIYPDLKLLPREQMPTVYTWACKDFSEDTVGGSDETFSARFKDKTIAQEFCEKMMEAVENSLGQ